MTPGSEEWFSSIAKELGSIGTSREDDDELREVLLRRVWNAACEECATGGEAQEQYRPGNVMRAIMGQEWREFCRAKKVST